MRGDIGANQSTHWPNSAVLVSVAFSVWCCQDQLDGVRSWQATREAVDRLGLDATAEKVTDSATIAGYGVMATHALVVDEKVISTGRLLTPIHIDYLTAAAA